MRYKHRVLPQRNMHVSTCSVNITKEDGHMKFFIEIGHKCKYIFAHEEILFLKVDYMTKLRKYMHIVRYVEYWENLCAGIQNLNCVVIN